MKSNPEKDLETMFSLIAIAVAVIISGIVYLLTGS